MRESRGCYRFKASEGKAVVGYRELSATKEIGYHRLSQKVNKIEIKLQNSYFTAERDITLSRIKGILTKINIL